MSNFEITADRPNFLVHKKSKLCGLPRKLCFCCCNIYFDCKSNIYFDCKSNIFFWLQKQYLLLNNALFGCCKKCGKQEGNRANALKLANMKTSFLPHFLNKTGSVAKDTTSKITLIMPARLENEVMSPPSSFEAASKTVTKRYYITRGFDNS